MCLRAGSRSSLEDMARRPERTLAAKILSRIEELAGITSSAGGLTRLYLTPEHKAAADLIMAWMRAIGMTAGIDAAGTVVGRVEGARPGAKTLLIGSHLDTVYNAGRYDGVLGVVVAIEALAELRRSSIVLPYAVEIVTFADAEGIRFPCALTGSLALADRFDPGSLHLRDRDGISLAEALEAFGSHSVAIQSLARDPTTLLGYVEVHTEQGPVLEHEAIPIGVVTAISGASRFTVELHGRAGHAGTLPMHLRSDALATAAEMILSIEQTARSTAGLVATVGSIAVEPGVVNAVPGAARFTIDVRSPVDRTRRAGIRQIDRVMRAIARRRQISFTCEETYAAGAATCDRRFIQHFTAAAERVAGGSIGLPSGAGHDGLALQHLCPIGMLFVRCKDGITHHPDEHVAPEDIETATRVLIEFLQRVSTNGRTIA